MGLGLIPKLSWSSLQKWCALNECMKKSRRLELCIQCRSEQDEQGLQAYLDPASYIQMQMLMIILGCTFEYSCLLYILSMRDRKIQLKHYLNKHCVWTVNLLKQMLLCQRRLWTLNGTPRIRFCSPPTLFPPFTALVKTVNVVRFEGITTHKPFSVVTEGPVMIHRAGAWQR